MHLAGGECACLKGALCPAPAIPYKAKAPVFPKNQIGKTGAFGISQLQKRGGIAGVGKVQRGA